MRAEAIAAMALPDIHLGHEWEGNPAGTNGRAFDSTYQRYALSKKDGEVTVRRVVGRPAPAAVRRHAPDEARTGRSCSVSVPMTATWRRITTIKTELPRHARVTRPAFVWDLEDPRAEPYPLRARGLVPLVLLGARPDRVDRDADGRVHRFDLATGRELAALEVGVTPSAVSMQPQGACWPSPP